MLFRQNANLKLVSLAAVIWVSPNALRDIQKTAARETNLKTCVEVILVSLNSVYNASNGTFR